MSLLTLAKVASMHKVHHAVDTVSSIVVGASLLNYAPESAAAAALVWYAIQIVQSQVVIKSWNFLINIYKRWGHK